MKRKMLDTNKIKRATLSVSDESVKDEKAKIRKEQFKDKKQSGRQGHYFHRQMGVLSRVFHRKIP